MAVTFTGFAFVGCVGRADCKGLLVEEGTATVAMRATGVVQADALGDLREERGIKYVIYSGSMIYLIRETKMGAIHILHIIK